MDLPTLRGKELRLHDGADCNLLGVAALARKKHRSRDLSLKLNCSFVPLCFHRCDVARKLGCRVKKSSVSYKSQSQLPHEPEIRELKIYVGELVLLSSSLRTDCLLILTLQHNFVRQDLFEGTRQHRFLSVWSPRGPCTTRLM